LFGRPVIIPFFAEAAGKYRRYVYFKKYFDEFILATSKKDLKAKVLQYIENEIKAPPLSDEMIKEYITYFDGKIVDRVVEEIKKTL
jgi:DNA-directed RNA polymerase specialized sigma54-like protein